MELGAASGMVAAAFLGRVRAHGDTHSGQSFVTAAFLDPGQSAAK